MRDKVGHAGDADRARPARVTGAVLVLGIAAALSLVWAVRSVLGYFESTEYGGIATLMPIHEFILDAPEQVILPLGLAVLAGTASLGVWQGRPWGRALAAIVTAIILLGAVLLTVGVVVEWGLPGSFAVLLIPPIIVMLVVGGYIVWTLLTSSTYFDRRRDLPGNR